jgi:hypothetical protein
MWLIKVHTLHTHVLDGRFIFRFRRCRGAKKLQPAGWVFAAHRPRPLCFPSVLVGASRSPCISARAGYYFAGELVSTLQNLFRVVSGVTKKRPLQPATPG